MQTTLNPNTRSKSLARFIDNNENLTISQKISFASLLTKRCKPETKKRVLSIIMDTEPMKWNWTNLFYRVKITSNGVKYVAGQSYIHEIKRLREDLLKTAI